VAADQPDTAAQEFREDDCIVMSQYQGPGAIWFRISRGWINGYGSEVPADWPTNHGAVLIARDGKPVTDA
jgi:hypothetical protein